jgi:hypothetical protein
MRAREFMTLKEDLSPLWFGDSKVVDRNGKPLVCYHAGSETITDFHPWTHFGTAVAANQRMTDRNGKELSGAIFPVYLRITNPLKVTDSQASDEATLLNGIIRGEYPNIDRDLARKDGCIPACEAAGYDGLVYNNRMEDRGKNSWVIFDPSQVRTAMNEGRIYPVDVGFGGVVMETKVVENPTAEQGLMLAKLAAKGTERFYLRGIFILGKRMYVGDGWKVTHDDLHQRFAAKYESWSSDLTTFEVAYENGALTYKTVKPGDYDVEKSNAMQQLLAGCKMFKPTIDEVSDGDETRDRARKLMADSTRLARSLNVRIHFKFPAFLAPEIEITDLYADTPGGGSGTKLMTAICQMADDAGFNLYVHPEQERNQGFYGRFGFQKSERHFGMLIRYCAYDEDDDMLDEDMSQSPESILQRARQMGFEGFGGLCGEAAIALNRVIFSGNGVLVGAFNKAFLEHEHLLGHIAVKINGSYWDADGKKSEDEITSWGMLDEHDPDYAEMAEEYGFDWNEETANEYELVEFDSDAEVLKYYDHAQLGAMVEILTKAKTIT